VSVRNPHWYNLNEGRDYPVDETASCMSVEDERLPQNIITDLRVRWPGLLGQYAFISAVSCTAGAVTVMLQAATTPDNTANEYTPLAAISLTRGEIDEGRQYLMDSLYPGVRAFIVFGSGVERSYTGRFTSPAATLLTPRAARAERSLPITSMAKLHAASELTGVVQLYGEPPVEVVREIREIDGVAEQCIVIRLVDDPSTMVGVESTVFKEFAGPCSPRPESQTCPDPQPIEFFNNVAPDCDGVLEVLFEGCAWIGRYVEECSINVDCMMGLTETCLPPFLPNHQGLLPSEYDTYNIAADVPDEPIPDDPSISEAIVSIGELPYTTCFSDGAGYFLVREGQFMFVSDYSPDELCPDESEPENRVSYATEGAASAGVRNVSVWAGFDVTTMFRKVTADVLLASGPDGSKHNGGIVINYRPHASYPDRNVYHYAVIDYDSQVFRLTRYNGVSDLDTATTVVPGIRLNHWYRMTATVRPHTEQTVGITLTLEDLDPPAGVAVPIDVVIGPVYVNNYYPDVGYFGFIANRSHSRFSFFRLEEQP